jgi:hypothetical protein
MMKNVLDGEAFLIHEGGFIGHLQAATFITVC